MMLRRKAPKSEFLEKFDAIWKEGPKIKYQCPDNWTRSDDPN
jgi:hypothetical protein